MERRFIDIACIFGKKFSRHSLRFWEGELWGEKEELKELGIEHSDCVVVAGGGLIAFESLSKLRDDDDVEGEEKDAH